MKYQQAREFISARKTVTQTQQQIPGAPTMKEDVPLVELIYVVFTRMPGESYRTEVTQVFMLLCSCDGFGTLNCLQFHRSFVAKSKSGIRAENI